MTFLECVQLIKDCKCQAFRHPDATRGIYFGSVNGDEGEIAAYSGNGDLLEIPFTFLTDRLLSNRWECLMWSDSVENVEHINNDRSKIKVTENSGKFAIGAE